MGIRREANALCVSLCNVSPILNFLHSHDDRFAAQIVYATGRCPPMYRLVTDCRSFHLQFSV